MGYTLLKSIEAEILYRSSLLSSHILEDPVGQYFCQDPAACTDDRDILIAAMRM